MTSRTRRGNGRLRAIPAGGKGHPYRGSELFHNILDRSRYNIAYIVLNRCSFS